MLDHRRLTELLHYNPISGIFVWKVDRGGPARSGCRAGTRHVIRYKNCTYARWYITIDYVKYFAHRLAWFYVHKKWPEREIDHIDGNPENNAIANLRAATRSQNAANKRSAPNTTSGHRGITYYCNGYKVEIYMFGTRHYIGRFKTLQEAIVARNDAARRIQGGFAHQTSRGA